MIRSRDCDALLCAALFDDVVSAATLLPVSALRALRRRRQRRRLARVVSATAVMLTVLLPAWWWLRQDVLRSTPSRPTRTWLVRTADRPVVEIVRSEVVVATVHSPPELADGVVVRTRSGLFAPASDEMLLALLAERSPVLIGKPGARRLVFQAEIAP